MTDRRVRRGIGMVLAAALPLVGCASVATGPRPHLVLAPDIDLARYMGTWYVIAEIPYVGERGNVGDREIYTLRPDGAIGDRYLATAGSFAGKPVDMAFVDHVVPGSHGAEWRVTFFWPIRFDYPILYVSPNYDVSLVGYPDRSLGWVFSRSPHMGDAELSALLTRFARQGYDVSKFRRVPQDPSEVGRPGFD